MEKIVKQKEENTKMYLEARAAWACAWKCHMIKIQSICRNCECNTKCKVIMKLKHLFYLLFIGFFLIILITSLMKESIIPMIPESIEDLVAQYSLKDLQVKWILISLPTLNSSLIFCFRLWTTIWLIIFPRLKKKRRLPIITTITQGLLPKWS